MNLAALEYRWSPNNRSASGNLADGAIGGPFYDPTQRLIYLRGKADENTDEYDQNVVMHEFSHHVTLTATSRNDSMGGSWGRQSPLDMRVAFSEGFGDALGLPEHVPDRAATQSGLDALLRAHDIFGRGANGAGETNGGGLPATARVLPVTGNFRAGEAAVLEAYDERNVDGDANNNGDSCFAFSVVKNR